MISGLCARKKIIGSTSWPVSQMEKAPGQAFVCGSACPGTAGVLGAEWGREGLRGSAVALTCPLSPVPVPASQPGTASLAPAVQNICQRVPRMNFCLSWEFLLEEIMLKYWRQGQGLAAFPGTSIPFPPSRPWGWARCRDAAPRQLPLHGKHSCHLIINTN